MDICPKCGLPKQACVCEGIAKSEERIKVILEKRKFGKLITLVTGLSKDVDAKEVAKALKNKLACGGTIKDGKIELQGEHLKKVKPILMDLGFPESAIED
jgi:translation initiation factor 1